MVFLKLNGFYIKLNEGDGGWFWDDLDSVWL